MMRSGFVLMMACVVAGCANRPHSAGLAVQQGYEDASSASLVFTPPVSLGTVPVELARDDRAPRAFVGYDEVTTSYFHIWTDDRQTNDGTDRYVRRSRIEQVGISYR